MRPTKEKTMCDEDKSNSAQNAEPEHQVLSMNECILRDAAATSKDFYTQTFEMIKSIPEKPDGKSPFNLEMMRQSARDRGYIPKF